MPKAALEAVCEIATLEDLPELGPKILKGETRGRVVIKIGD
jgi:hypothetical protein